MKNRSLIFLLGSLLSLTVSCGKVNQEKFKWAETGCADPWSQEPYRSEDKRTAVENYLLDQNVEVIEVNEKHDESYVTYCLACHCTTGNIFVVTVNKKYADRMLELNFTKTE